MIKVYLGIDVGSVNTKLTALDEAYHVLASLYLRTRGRQLEVVQHGLRQLHQTLNGGVDVAGVGTTGSGRYLAGVVLGADVIKNEITAHAVATSYFLPGVQTIIEIGGQDSKIIILREGVAVDFAMNTVCAAGTGAFLDQQAARLNINIESVGELALQSKAPVRIAGRCTDEPRCGSGPVGGHGAQGGHFHDDRRHARGYRAPGLLSATCSTPP